MITVSASFFMGLVAGYLLPIAIAALMVGLWLGERGRRMAAERHLTSGSPEGGMAAESTAPSKEAEDRFMEAGQAVSKETVERATKDLIAEAKALGIRVDPKQIKRDVETMMLGENVDG